MGFLHIELAGFNRSLVGRGEALVADHAARPVGEDRR
jgi:hypothetical protein